MHSQFQPALRIEFLLIVALQRIFHIALVPIGQPCKILTLLCSSLSGATQSLYSSLGFFVQRFDFLDQSRELTANVLIQQLAEEGLQSFDTNSLLWKLTPGGPLEEPALVFMPLSDGHAFLYLLGRPVSDNEPPVLQTFHGILRNSEDLRLSVKSTL
ncbi:hypothetical protein ARSEF4850_007643 [Beauveria asiatica]